MSSVSQEVLTDSAIHPALVWEIGLLPSILLMVIPSNLRTLYLLHSFFLLDYVLIHLCILSVCVNLQHIVSLTGCTKEIELNRIHTKSSYLYCIRHHEQ